MWGLIVFNLERWKMEEWLKWLKLRMIKILKVEMFNWEEVVNEVEKNLFWSK